MVLALVCLWLGFAAGFICAALLAGRSRDRRAERDADAEPGFEVEVRNATRPFRVMRMPVSRRRAAREELGQDR